MAVQIPAGLVVLAQKYGIPIANKTAGWVNNAIKAYKAKNKIPMTKDKLGKVIAGTAAASSLPLSILAQKTGQMDRDARKPLKKAGSGLSAKQKKAWVKLNTPEEKKKILDNSRTRGPLYK